MTLFYCVHYSFVPCLPFELVHKVLDGRRRNPPWQIPHAAVDGARKGERRPRQTLEGVGGRCCFSGEVLCCYGFECILLNFVLLHIILFGL